MMTSWDRPLLRCRHCGAEPALEAEQHSLISLDILDEMGQGRSLQEALDAWTRPEIMQDGYAWTCPAETCLSTEAPTTSHTIFAAAPVLGLHLKRWSRGQRREVIQHIVEPPRNLRFCDTDYVLRSMILHSGSSAIAGHYTASMYHRTEDGPNWWHYDDPVRRAVRAEDMSGTLVWKAYVCFYEQRL